MLRIFLPMYSSACAGVSMPSVVHSCRDAASACENLGSDPTSWTTCADAPMAGRAGRGETG